jgi:hypothetical protein
MAEKDPRVEHGGKPDYNDGADPYLRITGWLQR